MLMVKPLRLDRRKFGGQKAEPGLPGWELNVRQIILPRKRMNIVTNAGLKWLEDVENDSRELKLKK
jgi:ribosomal protein L15E